MNIEFDANHLQIFKDDKITPPDYRIMFSRDGVYVDIGLTDELMERLRQWLNNIHSSGGKANATE